MPWRIKSFAREITAAQAVAPNDATSFVRAVTPGCAAGLRMITRPRSSRATACTITISPRPGGADGGNDALIDTDAFEKSGVAIHHAAGAVRAGQSDHAQIIGDLHHRAADAVDPGDVDARGQGQELFFLVEEAQAQVAGHPVNVVELFLKRLP